MHKRNISKESMQQMAKGILKLLGLFNITGGHLVNLPLINLNIGDLNLREPRNDFEHLSFLLAGLGSKFDPFVTSVHPCGPDVP
jgi:hypothetical protein